MRDIGVSGKLLRLQKGGGHVPSQPLRQSYPRCQVAKWEAPSGLRQSMNTMIAAMKGICSKSTVGRTDNKDVTPCALEVQPQ